VRQPLLLGRAVPGRQQHARGQGTGQERPRVQGAAELGVHHARLGLGPGEAAELRRDHQPGQAEVAGQPGVQFLAVARLGLQRGAQRLRRELIGEKGSQGVLQSALVLVERRGFAIGHEAAPHAGHGSPKTGCEVRAQVASC
jgi:hypothetical protein